MGLQINTNVNALNAYRNLTGTQSSMTTSLERLSSGLRINRAADDAAGLAISEKLRSQVNGLNQAQANAQDGVSLIQTAEGALNEAHSILQRMRTLAVQSASDTNTNADRAQIQKEVAALTKEVDGISKRTQFNGMGLLDGSFSAKQLQIGANTGQTMGVSIASMGADGLGLSTGGTAPTATAIRGGTATSTITATVAGTVASGTYTIQAGGTGQPNVVLDSSGNRVGTMSADMETATIGDATVTFSAAVANGNKVVLGTQSYVADTVGTRVSEVIGSVQAGAYKLSGSSVVDASNKAVGTWDSVANKISFNDGASMTLSAALGSDTLTVTDGVEKVDLSTKAGAQNALKQIDKAIQTVSDQRADLGALQNRLTHTINNLGVSAENLAASESRIRDTDMAKEMTNFTRSQILQQAGVSMLAQANQSSQSVLKLLG